MEQKTEKRNRIVIEVTDDQNRKIEAAASVIGLSRNRYMLMRTLEAARADNADNLMTLAERKAANK